MLRIAEQGYFFAGGRYVETASGTVMAGQAYVEYQIPEHRSEPWPLVMIEGGGQGGSNFTGTPDGREGWAQFFLRAGYAVYVMDQVGRGRSAYHPDAYGPTVTRPAEWVQQRFTASARYALWPQAQAHTQWPGSGLAGDPVFDQFYAEQLPSIASYPSQQELNRDAGTALLDRIGPAILLTHSQAGAFGWLIADARPALVKAILAVEPNGPPVRDAEYRGAPEYFADGAFTKPYGLTAAPLTYDPPPDGPLRFARQSVADGPELMRAWLQEEPARRLVNLAGIPIAILMAEASYHAPYDHCTVRYLEQAGVTVDFIRLADSGIHGNGHMMMLEKNNQDVAALLASWLKKAVPG